MKQTREVLLTVNEVADALCLSPSAVYRAIDAGEIKALRVTSRPGGSLRVPASELERIFDRSAAHIDEED